jgi:hypothetical protein
MSALEEQRRLLDALMGSSRNGERAKHFTDSDVCKYYLCGLCPHDLFMNTVHSAISFSNCILNIRISNL